MESSYVKVAAKQSSKAFPAPGIRVVRAPIEYVGPSKGWLKGVGLVVAIFKPPSKQFLLGGGFQGRF